MLQISVIGNLGANAEIRVHNGSKFVSFRVASTRRYTKADSTQVEDTTWVACVLNGDGGQLTQYLTKGRKVYVSGDGGIETYSSPKERRMVSRMTCSVRSIELLGSNDKQPEQQPHDEPQEPQRQDGEDAPF